MSYLYNQYHSIRRDKENSPQHTDTDEEARRSATIISGRWVEGSHLTPLKDEIESAEYSNSKSRRMSNSPCDS